MDNGFKHMRVISCYFLCRSVVFYSNCATQYSPSFSSIKICLVSFWDISCLDGSCVSKWWTRSFHYFLKKEELAVLLWVNVKIREFVSCVFSVIRQSSLCVSFFSLLPTIYHLTHLKSHKEVVCVMRCEGMQMACFSPVCLLTNSDLVEKKNKKHTNDTQ